MSLPQAMQGGDVYQARRIVEAVGSERGAVWSGGRGDSGGRRRRTRTIIPDLMLFLLTFHVLCFACGGEPLGGGTLLQLGDRLEQPQQFEQQQNFVAAGRHLESFSSVSNSSILFLHVFKCAGTSLRQVLITWARKEGWTGAIVEYCPSKRMTNAGRICLNNVNDLAERTREKWLVRGSKMLAGHFLWDFRHYVTEPYLMVTTLRNPLELFVSSQQFMHKDETKTLSDSTDFVSNSMRSRLRWKTPTDIAFIRRFLESKTAREYNPMAAHTKEELMAMAQTAVKNLNTFYVVGVIEQYHGFIEVLKRSLDPKGKYPRMWKAAVTYRDNKSPVRSSAVLSGIDPDLAREFNSTVLWLQWQVYDVAVQLWDQRCREVLPVEDHSALCSVPGYR